MNTQKVTEPATPASPELRGYVPKPESLEDFVHNVQFQLDNVKGWLMADQDGLPHGIESAKAKAACVLSDAAALLGEFTLEIKRRNAIAAELIQKQNAGGVQ